MGNDHEHKSQKHNTIEQTVAAQKHDKPDKDKLKPFCERMISFTENGCLYIHDPALVEAIQIAIAVHGGVCIMADDPGRPGKEMNVVC